MSGGDLFAALRGGARFDKQRFASDISRFNGGAAEPANWSGASARSGGAGLLAPLDFFGDRRSAADGTSVASNKGRSSKTVGKAAEDRRDRHASGQVAGKSDDSDRGRKKMAKQRAAEGRECEKSEDDFAYSSSDEDGTESEKAGRGGGMQIFAGGEEVEDFDEAEGLKGGKKKAASAREKAAQETLEQEALFRKQMRISVTGDEVPSPVGSFEELQLSADQRWLRSGIESAGWTEPTPIQMQAIPVLMAGRDLLACAPTGSGKTGAFVIPLFARLRGPRKAGIRGLVIAPTRELATQIFQQCNTLRSVCKMQVKLLTKATAAAVATLQGEGGGRNHDVLVSTPARLVSLLQEGAIALETVEVVVVDEADKLFEDGFVSQLDEVLAACTHRRLQKALFSATLPPAVESLARTIMPHPVSVTVGGKVAASFSVKQKLTFCGNEEGKVIAMRQLIKEGLRPPALVFVQSVDRAKQLFRELIYDGINVDVMHADRTQAQRDRVIQQFRSGAIWVLICTDLMARGIDFKGVNLVINYDFPQSVVSYIHRVGRTGRAGREGQAVTFFTLEDAGFLRSIANVMQQSGCEVPGWMLTMKRAGREQRRKLAKRAPERPDIVQVPASERRRRAHKKQIVEQSKKQKLATA